MLDLDHFHSTTFLPLFSSSTHSVFILKCLAFFGNNDYYLLFITSFIKFWQSWLLIKWNNCFLIYLQGAIHHSFLSDRSIWNNILIAQNINHSTHKSKEKNPFLIIKIDTEKAYDRLSGTTLINTLKTFNFLDKFILWIYTCISSPQFSCVINSEPSPLFKG